MKFPQIDKRAAIAHLQALGYQVGETVYLRAIWSGKNRAEKLQGKIPNLPWKRLENLQRQGCGIYFVVNSGGHEDSQIKQSRAVFYEHDNLDKEVQVDLWRSLDLPEPTIQVDTGGKSIHSYWRLDLPVEQWRELQTNLLEFADADRTLKNPSRVMRLAGCWHQGSRQQSQIVSQGGQAYRSDDFAVVAPPKPQPLPSIPERQLADPIPLEKCLSLSDRGLIDDGAPEGQRNNAGARLARSLIGTENYLRTEGVVFSGTARQLFDYFCSRCNPVLDAKEAEQIWKSAEKGNPTPTLTPEYLHNCIKGWEKQQHKQTQNGKSPVQATDQPQEVIQEEVDRIPRIVREYHLLRENLGDRIRLNSFTQEIEIDGKSTAIDKIRLDLAIDHGIYLKSGREDTQDIVCKLAEGNKYSPVAEYLEQCYQQYGGDTSILDNIAERYFGQTASIYSIFVRRTLIGAVARAYNPGCKMDTALILQGKQGHLKSSWFKHLCGEQWFDDSLGSVSDKDERLKLHRSWFIEWAELETVFSRKDVAATKAFLTSATDHIRPPYARSIQAMPRHSVIVGTTNKDEFLSDPTGNRRFWVIPCLNRIPIDLLKAERDRIWAAVVALYKAGESYWLSPDEELAAAAIAEEFQTRDPWEELIASFVEDREIVATKEILNDLLKIELGRQDKSQQMRAADCLRKLGWRRKFELYRTKRQWVWIPPDLPDPPRSTFTSEVDQPSNLELETVLSNPDPPDPPPDQHLAKTSNGNGHHTRQSTFTNFAQIGGSGGSGGSEVDKSMVLPRSTSDPPLGGRSKKGGSGLETAGLPNGLPNYKLTAEEGEEDLWQ